jgi:hypothetical protein
MVVGKGRDGDFSGIKSASGTCDGGGGGGGGARCHPQIWSVALVQRAVLSVLIFGKLWLHIDTQSLAQDLATSQPSEARARKQLVWAFVD